MKYLVTGGCGFLGSNLSKKILEEDQELFILDNLYREGSSKNLDWLNSLGKVNFFNCDISDSNEVEFLVKKIKPEIIFHLAGQVAMTTSIEDPFRDFQINTLGTLNILESMRKFSPKSVLIYSSTNKVYGDLEHYSYEETDTRYNCIERPNGFNEKETLDFHSPYGVSKGSADQYVLDYYRIFGLKTLVFRHSSIFGGRQFSTSDQGWVGWFAQKALEIKRKNQTVSLTISGNGKQVRDLLFCDDAVNLYFSASKKISEIKGQAFNIGGGIENSFSLLELFSFLESKLDISMEFISLPKRASDQKVFVADYTKAKNLFNWKPAISKEDGVEKMLKWIEESSP
tara:strand:- start:21 stop:1046 length:1026 start_codon:yes stop_codon:yes gene_type:complete